MALEGIELMYVQLTPALVQTLNLIGEGLRIRAIARKRSVSYHTVRTHIGVLEEITGCHSLDEVHDWWDAHKTPFTRWRLLKLATATEE
jgi:DNA-binding CsgD family transcriptional regulator